MVNETRRPLDRTPRAPRNGTDAGAAFRVLPNVDTLARAVQAEASGLSETALTRFLQSFLAQERATIQAGARPTRTEIEARLSGALVALHRPRLTPLLNATGVVIHTNLGRAPVSAAAAAAMSDAAANAVPLELDPETARRGGRMLEISALMRLLTGAEASLVVNNCAAAVLLVLTALAAGRSVIVSRGEAVEIGGGFRIPDVLRQSGAQLVEVGTTNRTYSGDYLAATDDQTAAFLKVHPSNFAIEGFVHAASIAELAEIGRERDISVIEDLGSGALLETMTYGLAHEPTIGESLAAGANLVMASGDKLLGGPQAGIIAGEATWVDRVARHPLARAVRADKTCLAGLAATLRHYLQGDAESTIPVWRMIAATPDAIQQRAATLAALLQARGIALTVEPTIATIGGGALPGEHLASWSLALADLDTDERDITDLGRRLRLGEPAVYGRIERHRLLLDLRTILPEDDRRLADAILSGVTGSSRPAAANGQQASA